MRKNGPPSSAVITPTGISAGAMTVRAKVSHNVRKDPPARMEAGARKRCPGPTRRRQM